MHPPSYFGFPHLYLNTPKIFEFSFIVLLLLYLMSNLPVNYIISAFKIFPESVQFFNSTTPTISPLDYSTSLIRGFYSLPLLLQSIFHTQRYPLKRKSDHDIPLFKTFWWLPNINTHNYGRSQNPCQHFLCPIWFNSLFISLVSSTLPSLYPSALALLVSLLLFKYTKPPPQGLYTCCPLYFICPSLRYPHD